MSEAEQTTYDQDESESERERRAQQDLDDFIHLRFRDEPTDDLEAIKTDGWTPTLVFFQCLKLLTWLLMLLLICFCKPETMTAINLKVHGLRMAIKELCPRVLSDNIHSLLEICRFIQLLQLVLIILRACKRFLRGLKAIIKLFSPAKVVDVIEPVVDISATNVTKVQLSE